MTKQSDLDHGISIKRYVNVSVIHQDSQHSPVRGHADVREHSYARVSFLRGPAKCQIKMQLIDVRTPLILHPSVSM